jgi:acetyltransferase-like isoleucine patch superfamily enzyme
MFAYYWYKVIRKLAGAGIKNSTVGFDSKIEAGSIFINSTIGRHSFCGYDCFINNTEIGAFVSIADRVYIGRGIHPVDWVSTSPVFYNNRDSVKTKYSKYEREPHPRTYVGNDVWIGDGVYIKPGVRIGNGSVIGMGSIVTKDVPPYTIVAGNPAKIIRNRFSEEIVEKLLKSEWWNLPPDVLEKAAKEIKNPIEFLKIVVEG